VAGVDGCGRAQAAGRSRTPRLAGREQPSHGFKRIQDLLKQKYLVVVTRKQIRRVLKDSGLLETCDSSFDKKVDRTSKGDAAIEAKPAGEI